MTREHNEDVVLETRRLVAVADGVGGGEAGEVASRAVISTLQGLAACRLSAPLASALAAAVTDGNERIAFIAACRPDTQGMSTTVTAVALGDSYTIANVGDSRTYLLRDGELAQLTRDDSYVQALIERGHLDPLRAWGHPLR